MCAYDVAAGDAEGDEGGGEAEAAAEGLGPGEGGAVVDDGGAVAEHGGRAHQKPQRRERARVGRVRAELVHGRGCGAARAALARPFCARLVIRMQEQSDRAKRSMCGGMG